MSAPYWETPANRNSRVRGLMDLIQHTSAFAEIVSDFVHYSPDICLVALGKRQQDRPSCFTDSQGIPTIVRCSDN